MPGAGRTRPIRRRWLARPWAAASLQPITHRENFDTGATSGAAKALGGNLAFPGHEAIGVDPFWWAAYELSEEVFAMAKPHPPNPRTDVPAPAANGEGVRCPRCGSTDLQRIHRRLLDRLLSLVRPVYRFRGADPRCALEGNVPPQWFSSDRYRRHYLR